MIKTITVSMLLDLCIDYGVSLHEAVVVCYL